MHNRSLHAGYRDINIAFRKETYYAVSFRNTIELTAHTSFYYILGLLCVKIIIYNEQAHFSFYMIPIFRTISKS